MDIYMYKNSAEKIVLNKDNYLSSEIHLSGYLRDECDIINPVIEISKAAYSKIWYGTETVDVQSTGQDVISENPYTIPVHNYIYIPKFNRYYFVDNITSVRKGLWRISMSVDVLMSFRDKIKNLTGIVKRSTIATRQNVRDEAAIVTGEVTYQIFDGDTDLFTPTKFSFVGAGMERPDYTFGIITVSNSESYISELWFDAFHYEYNDDVVVHRAGSNKANLHRSNMKFIMLNCEQTITPGIELDTTIDYLINDVMNNSDEINSIISLIQYPFNFATDPFFKNIYDGEDSNYLVNDSYNWYYPRGARVDPNNSNQLGFLRFAIGSSTTQKYYGCPISNSFINKLKAFEFDFSTQISSNTSNDSWEYQHPYAEFLIYLPFLGFRKLEYSKIRNRKIKVYYVMNWDDGSANVCVVSEPAIAYQTRVQSNGLNVINDNGEYITSNSVTGTNKQILILEENCQVGETIPLSASNEAENARKREAISLQSAAGYITSILSIIGGAALTPVTGGASAIGVIAGFGGLIGTGINYAAQDSQIIDYAKSMGNLGNVAKNCLQNKCFVLMIKKNVSYPSGYENIFGKIDLTTRTISNISNGYVQFAHIHIDGIDTATSNELDQIERELMNGILIN